MADEPMAPDEFQETPPAAPEDEGLPAEPDEPSGESGDEPDIDYRKRFEDLQPELTKAQQANSEFRKLFEAAQQGDPEALEILGIGGQDPGEAEPEDDYLDPDEELRQEVAQLREALETRDQFEQQAVAQESAVDHIDTALDQLEGELGFELSDDAVDFIVDRAVSNIGEDGMPDVQAAGKMFLKAAKAEWGRSLEARKNAPRAPLGEPGEEEIDLSDDDARRRAAVRIMEAEGS